MASTYSNLDLRDAIDEVAKTGPELESALEKFVRGLRGTQTLGRQPRSSTGIRLPQLPRWRPVLPQLRLPKRLWTTIPATVLHKRRAKTRHNGGLYRVGAELQVGVQHMADLIRARLLDLRRKLQTFHNDFARFVEALHLAALFLPGRRRS